MPKANTIDYVPNIRQVIREVQAKYSQNISAYEKKKSLIKSGNRVTVGTGWETLMTLVGSETEETYATDNVIDTVVSSSTSDVGKIVTLEHHVLQDSVNAVFGTQEVTLNGTTPVTLDTPVFRANTAYNSSPANPLVGDIFFYEDNTGRDDDKTHLVIEAGEQKSEKGATCISYLDYWIVESLTVDVLSKVTKYGEFRLEVKPIFANYWTPITQTFAMNDTAAGRQILKDPYSFVPANYDVRIAVKTNTSSVVTACGIAGKLASIVS